MTRWRYVGGKEKWRKVDDPIFRPAENTRNVPAYDPTLSQYIRDNGGIVSMHDGSVHTSERSYKEHLKRNNLVIKDW